MNKLFRLKKFLEYQWRAKTKFYLHSPFVYQFYLNVIEGANDEKFNSIHSLRKQLRKNASAIKPQDHETLESSTAKLGDLENHWVVSEKNGKFLYHLVKYFKPSTILELGNSDGILSSYLALANPDAKIISFAPSLDRNEAAKQNHSSLGIKNVELISGNLEEMLSSSLKNTSTDLIFFESNQLKKGNVLQYFHQCIEHVNEKSIFIFEDIYWDKERYKAWNTIKQHPQITLTIDLFRYGICFFRRAKLAKENFVLRY